jgi:prepilin peptidase CpaA
MGNFTLVAAFLYLSFILVIVSIVDLKKRKISNIWSAVNIFNFLIFLWIMPNQFKFSFETFQFPLIFFLVSFVLYWMKIMGAGDSKFISTFYFTVPVAEQDNLFIIQLSLTVLIGIFLLLMNSLSNLSALREAYRNRDLTIFRRVYGKKFPYSPVILLSWMVWGAFYGRNILN